MQVGGLHTLLQTHVAGLYLCVLHQRQQQRSLHLGQLRNEVRQQRAQHIQLLLHPLHILEKANSNAFSSHFSLGGLCVKLQLANALRTAISTHSMPAH